MSKLNGYGGSVVINSNSVAEVEEWSTDESANIYTGVAKGDSRVTGEAGEVTGKLNMTMFLDPSDTTGQGAITVGATLSSFELYIDGNTSGKDYYTCTTGVVESVSKSSPMGMGKFTVSVHLNAALVDATVA